MKRADLREADLLRRLDQARSENVVMVTRFDVIADTVDAIRGEVHSVRVQASAEENHARDRRVLDGMAGIDAAQEDDRKALEQLAADVGEATRVIAAKPAPREPEQETDLPKFLQRHDDGNVR